jgi:hypothetical protein
MFFKMDTQNFYDLKVSRLVGTLLSLPISGKKFNLLSPSPYCWYTMADYNHFISISSDG